MQNPCRDQGKTISQLNSKPSKSNYIGRFAPSATGHLHLGSLVTAFACALEAEQRHGRWFVRIDDLDTYRCSEESIVSIRSSIESFFSHAPPFRVRLQTDQKHQYKPALRQLIDQGLVYACNCSRRSLQQPNQGPHNCRLRPYQGPDPELHLQDACYRFLNPGNHKGIAQQDSILYRRDRCYAYHLACVVDDQLDGVTHIIRGADLQAAEQPQAALIQALGYNKIQYDYIPLVRNELGQKLSKQHHAPAIFASAMTPQERYNTLKKALAHLHWPCEDFMTTTSSFSIHKLWQWCVQNWSIQLNAEKSLRNTQALCKHSS